VLNPTLQRESEHLRYKRGGDVHYEELRGMPVCIGSAVQQGKGQPWTAADAWDTRVGTYPTQESAGIALLAKHLRVEA
jgi:hypothetical protein